jgi:hypothetical protein
MREAITGHQRPSEAIRGHQRPSKAIRGHQRPSEAIRRTTSQAGPGRLWLDGLRACARRCSRSRYRRGPRTPVGRGRRRGEHMHARERPPLPERPADTSIAMLSPMSLRSLRRRPMTCSFVDAFRWAGGHQGQSEALRDNQEPSGRQSGANQGPSGAISPPARSWTRSD